MNGKLWYMQRAKEFGESGDAWRHRSASAYLWYRHAVQFYRQALVFPIENQKQVDAMIMASIAKLQVRTGSLTDAIETATNALLLTDNPHTIRYLKRWRAIAEKSIARGVGRVYMWETEL